MPNFTRADGTTITIPASSIVRLRPAFPWEYEGPVASMLFKPALPILDLVETAGPALQAEVATFTFLPGIKNRPLWFDAAKASDPREPTAHESGNGVLAIVPVGGIGMRVIVSVEDAQVVINEARAAS